MTFVRVYFGSIGPKRTATTSAVSRALSQENKKTRKNTQSEKTLKEAVVSL